jgi:hypothetical protein
MTMFIFFTVARFSLALSTQMSLLSVDKPLDAQCEELTSKREIFFDHSEKKKSRS